MAETAPVPQAPAAESTQTTRPTRPDENVFKEALAKAEKAHKASMDKLMGRANDKLEKWETVKRFAILDHEFSVDDGGVTPNMKVRRGAVATKYAHVVDSLYDQQD